MIRVCVKISVRLKFRIRDIIKGVNWVLGFGFEFKG